MTKRTAKVSVRNDTSSPLFGVGVVHKYSDNYKNSHTWNVIQPGGRGEPFLEVEYNTGAFTTGRDWSAVTWMRGDTSTLFYTDPKNFRSIFDDLESVMPDVVSAVAGDAAGSATAETGPGAIIAAGAAEAGSKVICNALFNSEGTTGFKQHILRAEDENALTEIIVHNNMTVTFRSKSGVSKTVVSSKRVK